MKNFKKIKELFSNITKQIYKRHDNNFLIILDNWQLIVGNHLSDKSLPKKLNKDNTLKSFKSCKKILDRLFEAHGGLIFNTAGDSILAEFTSAVSAVVCASEFQKLIKERNSSGDAVVKLEFRIGINMGDVIKEGSNLYGDGVNISARLETLAQKGGISLSKSVYELVNSKTQFLFQDLGEQRVKDESFHAYDVLIDTAAQRILKPKKEKKPN